MRCSLVWAICCLLVMQTVAAAQQNNAPIQPNYGRSTKKVAFHLPSPGETTAPIGTGVSVIPQQGSVDLGTSSAPAPVAPAIPSYTYSAVPAPYSAVPAPAATYSAPNYSAPAYSAPVSYGSAHGGDCSTCATGSVNAGCSHCGSSTCHGGCRFKLGGHGKCHKGLGLGGLLSKHGGCGNGGWFGGVYFMQLFRSDDDFGRAVAFDVNNPTTNVLTTGQAHMKSASGLGVRLGKMINPCSAVEFIYWQVFPDDQTAVATESSLGHTVSTPINFSSLTYDSTVGPGPVPASDFFTDSSRFEVTRTYDYRNFELNFLRLPFIFGGNPCSRARVALLMGPRYFRAEETLTIFSDDFNEVKGDDPVHELAYVGETENHMVGFQLGTLLDLRFTKRLSGQFGTKGGIYNNRINQHHAVGGGAGGALIGTGPDAGQPFAMDVKRDGLAFLGEIDAGLAYCLTNNIRLTGGYKLMGVAGYASPVNNIPTNFDSLAQSGIINNDGSLILHGVYLGAEYCW